MLESISSRRGRGDLIELLLAASPDINRLNADGRSPLRVAGACAIASLGWLERLRMFWRLLLMCLACCSMPAVAAMDALSPSQRDRVAAVMLNATRIESMAETPPPGYRKQAKDVGSHWQIWGEYVGRDLIRLEATLQEGSVVRTESYLFDSAGLSLVRIVQYWDVDNPRDAKEPGQIQKFFIERGSVIYEVYKRGESPGDEKHRVSHRPADVFVSRASVIEKILNSKVTEIKQAETLRSFPFEFGFPG